MLTQLRASCPPGSAAVSSQGVGVDEVRAPHGVVLFFSPCTGKFLIFREQRMGALGSHPSLHWVPEPEVWEGVEVLSLPKLIGSELLLKSNKQPTTTKTLDDGAGSRLSSDLNQEVVCSN